MDGEASCLVLDRPSGEGLIQFSGARGITIGWPGRSPVTPVAPAPLGAQVPYRLSFAWKMSLPSLTEAPRQAVLRIARLNGDEMTNEWRAGRVNALILKRGSSFRHSKKGTGKGNVEQEGPAGGARARR